MSLFPLYNSVRIAAISTLIVFFLGIAAAYYIAKLPRAAKTALDLLLTLPLILPPTVVGCLLLFLLDPEHGGSWILAQWGVMLTMRWWSAIFAVTLIVFPLMYHAARGAFDSFDETLSDAGRTLGLSNTYIFWHIRLPHCRRAFLAGAALAFARALGEDGATYMLSGCIPGKTATAATEVYRLWTEGSDALALRWVLIDFAVSAAALLAAMALKRREGRR